VEVAAEARPPVCRVLDYSKYKYEQEQKAKQARKHQKQVTVREIKLRPKIAQNDYETKKGHVERFLRHQDRVKITIMFRGRETTHPERGERLLMQLAEDVATLGVVEQRPNLDGRNMTMLLAPLKPKEQEAEEEAVAAAAAEAVQETETQAAAPVLPEIETGSAPQAATTPPDDGEPDAEPAAAPEAGTPAGTAAPEEADAPVAPAEAAAVPPAPAADDPA
jgi:translation initiation factor IF-3